MALRNLTPETMLTISGRWLDPERDRPAFDQLPLLAPLLPVIDQRHRVLIAAQPAAAGAAELVVIRDQQRAIDHRHDRKIRGVHYVLTGFAELADDPDRAAAFLGLRDRLLPEGRRATRRSFLDQAGDALRLPARLDDGDRQQLAALATPWGPLVAHVDAWIDAAARLGRLEDHKARLEGNGDTDVTPAQARAAIFDWIQMARTVQINLAVDPAATDDLRRRILDPLQDAEARADRRAAERAERAEQATDATPDPADTLDPADDPADAPVLVDATAIPAPDAPASTPAL